MDSLENRGPNIIDESVQRPTSNQHIWSKEKAPHYNSHLDINLYNKKNSKYVIICWIKKKDVCVCVCKGVEREKLKLTKRYI